MKWANLGVCVLGALVTFYLFVTWRWWESLVMLSLTLLNGVAFYMAYRPAPTPKENEQFRKGSWR